MKIRSGFVSNSSSSSFLIFGTRIGDGIIDNNGDKIDEWDLSEYLEGISVKEKLALKVYHLDECGYIYVGLSWDAVKDNETGNQFKARAHQALKQVLGTNYDKEQVTTLSEAWYNG